MKTKSKNKIKGVFARGYRRPRRTPSGRAVASVGADLEKEAYQAGYKVGQRRDGTFDENPHEWRTERILHKAWSDGWLTGGEDYLAARQPQNAKAEPTTPKP